MNASIWLRAFGQCLRIDERGYRKIPPGPYFLAPAFVWPYLPAFSLARSFTQPAKLRLMRKGEWERVSPPSSQLARLAIVANYPYGGRAHRLPPISCIADVKKPRQNGGAFVCH